MRTRIFRNILLGMLGMVGLFSISNPANAGSLSLSPGSSTLASVGDTETIDLFVSGAVDLYGYNFSLTFDPSVIHIMNISAGPALSTAGNSFFVPGEIDNTSGALGLTGETLLSAIRGFTGSGVLASIQIMGVGNGSSAITFGDVLLIDSALNTITTTPINATVQVSAAIPEPSTVALMLAGLAAIGVAGRKSGCARPVTGAKSVS